MNDPSCPFCAICLGQDEAEIVGSGDGWLAFFPINPATPGHTLIVPTDHVTDLWQTDVVGRAELLDAAILVGQAIRAALKPEGLNLITSAGEAAEQTIFHLHIHIVPRWQDDGFGPIWPSGQRVDPTDLDRLASAVRSTLGPGTQ